MPAMTGVELLHRSLHIRPGAVRIILTGYTESEDLMDAINQGHVHRYITKPWDPGSLRKVVKQELGRWELKREQERLGRELHRINSRLDQSFNFETHYIRGRAKMKTRLGLALAVMMALALNVFLTYEQVPDMAVEWLTTRIESLPGFILLMNAFLLLVGCFMDIGSAILILSPLLQPIAVAQGMDAVHFGVVMVVNLEMGYLTPPMGLNIIVAMTAFNESFGEICRAVLPFLALMLIALVTVSFWPGLSLFLLQ